MKNKNTDFIAERLLKLGIENEQLKKDNESLLRQNEDIVDSLIKSGGFDWKITAKKFSWIAAEVLISGGICYLTDNNLYLAIIPVLEAIRNVIKHKYQESFPTATRWL